MNELKGQLTVRGILIGCVGCIVITAASAYMALKLGALPWPIVFAAVISLVFLKIVSKGSSTLNETNVTHTLMSAGAMVAGGLAFTIPGAWMLGLADQISIADMLIIALAGVALGLVCTALLRRHFVEDAQLEFPIGQAAAQTLKAGEAGGSTGKKLFGAMGLSGVFAFFRDALGVIPSMVATLPIPGVVFGIYLSPMMLAVGFLVGLGAVVAWFAGAVFANFGIIVGGTAAGWWDTACAQGIVSSLGMGVMMGCGVAVICKDVLPKGLSILRRAAKSCEAKNKKSQDECLSTECAQKSGALRFAKVSAGTIACVVAAVVLAVSIGLGLSPVVSVVLVLLSFVATSMSAQSVGQTGIDPMEIFGLTALLIIATFADVAQVQLFFIAAIVAVACGLAGDVMNDFKAGHILGTNPLAQIVAQAIGGILGALVSVAVMFVLLKAYGADAFGVDGAFVAAQASVVATMVSGVPNVSVFVAGLLLGFVLHVLRMPSMMIGLGIYLPFYLSLTAFLGCMVKVVYDFINKRRLAAESKENRALRLRASEESGLVVAAGLLGGESVVGILIALVVTFSGLLM